MFLCIFPLLLVEQTCKLVRRVRASHTPDFSQVLVLIHRLAGAALPGRPLLIHQYSSVTIRPKYCVGQFHLLLFDFVLYATIFYKEELKFRKTHLLPKNGVQTGR